MSLARGLAITFLICAALIVVAILWPRPKLPTGPLSPFCPRPIEIVDVQGSRAICADEIVDCGELVAGDRVIVTTTGACAREPGAMQASLRLLYDLKLDLNRATAEELALLDELGPKLADAIVSHRMAHGRFRSLDELALVPGVGPKKLAALKSFVQVYPGD